MAVILVILFLLFLTLSYIEDLMAKYKDIIYWSACVLLILLAAFRPLGVDNDSEVYQYYYENIDNDLMLLKVEYSFILLGTWCRHITNDVHILFFIYAILGVTIKMVAFRKLSPIWFLPLAIYVSNLYLVHDMTQIRAGVSSACFLMALYYICEDRRKKAFVYMLVATFFHYSSLILFPILFVRNVAMSRIRWRCLLFLVVPFGYAIFFSGLDVLSLIPIPLLSERLEVYQAMSDAGISEGTDVFNPYLLMKITLFTFSLFYYEALCANNKYMPILVYVQAFYILMYFLFGSLQALAGRIYGLLGIVDIILFSNVFYTIRPAYISRLVVMLIGLAHIYVNYFMAQIIQF